MKKKRLKRTLSRMTKLGCVPCAGLASALLWSTAVAGPQNANVQHGNVIITQNGNIFQITQSTNSAIVNYSSFNLSSGQQVFFIQPGNDSAILNRINNGQPTSINGSIAAPGHVMFVNPAGIVFGNNAAINANGFHAVGGDIDNQNFIDFFNNNASELTFTNLTGSVVNHGQIMAQDVANLVGLNVANHGSINVGSGGVIAMTAADGSVTLQPNNGYFVTFTNSATPAANPGNFGVSNTGTLNAPNGTIRLGAGDIYSLAAVHLKGDGIAAKSFLADGDVRLGSDVTIDAEESIFSSTIDSGNFVNPADRFELTLTGDAMFMDDLGSLTSLQALTVGGETDLLGNVTTVGTQQYAGAVRVNDDSILTGSEIAFGSTVNTGPLAGPLAFKDLTINGDVTFFGNVGNLQRLGALTVNGQTFLLGNEVFTDQNQIYNGAVWLLADAKLTTNDVNGIVSFGDILNTGFAAGPATFHNLEIFSNTEFHANVGMNKSLASLNVNGTSLINADHIRTRNQQVYAGAVTLERDAMLQSQLGGSMFFLGTIDGNHALLVDTAGLTQFFDRVGDTDALASLTTTGGGIVHVDTDLIRTVGEQRYGDAVWLLRDATMLVQDTNASAIFEMTLDSFALPGVTDRFALLIDGNAEFYDQVGGTNSLQMLEVSRDALVSTDLIRTRDGQRYGFDPAGGTLTLASNALLLSELGGDMTFNTIVGPHDLVVDTSGTTRFDGAVGEGAGNALASLTVTGGGQTEVNSSSINTIGDQNYDDAVTLISAGTFNAGQDVNFASTIEGGMQDLTVNAANVRFLDSVNNIMTMNTAGSGNAFIGTNIDTNGGMNIGHDIVLLTDVTLTDHGSSGINLTRTINSEAGSAFALSVVALNGNIAVGENIGELNPLGSLELTSGGTIVFSSELVQTVGDILLNESITTVGVPAVATIGANGDIVFNSLAGNFSMGQNQKMSGAGSIEINADTATLGDMSSLGDMTVNANSILLMTREPSTVLNADGTTTTDFGLDFVSGGQFFFSVVPVLLGDGVAVFSSPNSGLDGNGTLSNFLQLRRTEEVTTASLLAGNPTFFDLAASGTAITDLAEALAELVEEADEGDVNTAVTLGPVDLDRLLEIGVQGRVLTQAELQDFTQGRGLYLDAPSTAVLAETIAGAQVNVERVDRRVVDQTLATYEGIRFGAAADDPAAADRSDQIRSTLGESWQPFAAQADQPSGAQFTQHLMETGDEDALILLTDLRQLDREMGALGLTGAERRRAMRVAVRDFVPEGMTADDLVEAVRALPQ
ncbi:MAG: filamentous hemagglutinin N-terminal domain-containing protein [Phycisphaerales bacterium]|nr:MAG: filamentous hemagglutinin N-terminal domain-containing protein [Phycisphaerales bacterium]